MDEVEGRSGEIGAGAAARAFARNYAAADWLGGHLYCRVQQYNRVCNIVLSAYIMTLIFSIEYVNFKQHLLLTHAEYSQSLFSQMCGYLQGRL